MLDVRISHAGVVACSKKAVQPILWRDTFITNDQMICIVFLLTKIVGICACLGKLRSVPLMVDGGLSSATDPIKIQDQ